MSSQLETYQRCWACGGIKPAAAFAFANQRLGTLQGHCRKCHAGFRRAHYLMNKADYVRRAVIQVRERRDQNRQRLLAYLLTHPCIGCGRADPVVLEFDHRDNVDKVEAVALMAARRRWAAVEAEIQKCDVRCVNCHRRRTARQQGWRRSSLAVNSRSTRE